jgi:hypothetical protein
VVSERLVTGIEAAAMTPLGAAARRRRPIDTPKGDIVRRWSKDGIPIDDEELGDLAASDGEAFCELDGVRFRFTAATIERRPARPAPRHDAAVVLTLRQIDAPRAADPIYLVEFADAGLLASTDCEAQECGRLADALEIADRTARRYVCSELFRKARVIIDQRAA